MTGYHLALFVHLLALIAAAVASGLVHLSEHRFHHSGSLHEARQWHTFAGVTSRTFPIAVLVLVGTGAYMVAGGAIWPWSAGWVRAGLAGAIVLMGTGAVIGKRSARIGRMLEERAQTGAFDAATSLPADRIIGMLSWSNTCLALAVVFDMVSKPTLIPALGILVVGVLVGLSVAAATEAKAVTAEEPAASVQGDPAG